MLEDAQLAKLLAQENYISEEDLKGAEEAVKSRRSTYGDYFLSQGLVTHDILGQAVAEYYHIPYADLNSNIPPREIIIRMPEEVAERYHAILIEEKDDVVQVATDDPEKKGLAETMRAVFPDRDVQFSYALTKDIKALFVHYRKALNTRFAKIIENRERIAPEIFEEIIHDAMLFRASDIHFEPERNEVVIRFRIDGIMQEAGRIPKNYYANLLNRIKVMASLPTDEHMSAQDGAVRYEKEDAPLDIRVSVLPTLDGEKVVMRLLAQYVQTFTLSHIGLSSAHQELVEEAARKPFGMILVSGPTGSGKTTTLYTILKRVNSPEINISTIEDPVEYRLAGISQIQVNPKTNLTFAKGLRSIVRQDPDVILVGEIRDRETAEIAVNAALTGHLLFSTFHANDAPTTIPRLLTMGIEPFLLASTLEAIVAQRLVRRICEKCRTGYTLSLEEVKNFPHVDRYFSDIKTAYRGKGCDLCGGTGYNGRIGIFEFIKMTPELKNLTLKDPSAIEIWKMAREQGSLTLFEDGVEKVRAGVTTIDELYRVAQPPINSNS